MTTHTVEYCTRRGHREYVDAVKKAAIDLHPGDPGAQMTFVGATDPPANAEWDAHAGETISFEVDADDWALILHAHNCASPFPGN